MPLVLKTLMLAGLATLAACTTAPAGQTPPAPAEAAQKIAAAPAAPLEESMTGSRIRKRSNDGGDRTVKTVGARDARDALDSAMRPLNGSGQ